MQSLEICCGMRIYQEEITNNSNSDYVCLNTPKKKLNQHKHNLTKAVLEDFSQNIRVLSPQRAVL